METAGYAILAMLANDARSYGQQARRVIKWITAQRNGQGGFYSTQVSAAELCLVYNYIVFHLRRPCTLVKKEKYTVVQFGKCVYAFDI